jgi:hypothetical protein
VAAAAVLVVAVFNKTQLHVFNQDGPLWMVALWDVSTGTFFPGQDWQHEQSWEDATMSEAAICVKGLTNMQPYYGKQLAHSPESIAPWEWCKRVVDGRMPHGALLAHARLKGTTMADEHGLLYQHQAMIGRTTAVTVWQR